ncbi:MAG: type II secretion system F family protein, partial [Proteobacteria bacterium]|nr:type II secretion system F family protein [Pseudomonadota bacterium]
MPIYEYKGRNPQGEVVKGQLEGASTSEIASHLMNTGITPVDIHELVVKQTDALQNLKQALFNRAPDINELL